MAFLGVIFSKKTSIASLILAVCRHNQNNRRCLDAADANAGTNATRFLAGSGYLVRGGGKSRREILGSLSDKHEGCSTRSAEGLSAVKGHLNTAYMADTSLQGHSKCLHPHAARGHSPSYPSSTWGQSPCCMFRSGLMHGEKHPLNIAGEEGGQETLVRNQTNRKKRKLHLTFP